MERKLLKSPDTNGPWGALYWVNAPKWYCVYYNGDGSVYKENIGPIERQQFWLEIRKPQQKE